MNYKKKMMNKGRHDYFEHNTKDIKGETSLLFGHWMLQKYGMNGRDTFTTLQVDIANLNYI